MSALSEADELVSKLRMIKHQEDLNLPWSVTSDILSQLATCLRNSEVRGVLSSSDLPCRLAEILSQISESESQSADALTLAEQVGRVAANLAANCDVGRNHLLEANYIEICCHALQSYCKVIETSLATIKTLTASLLNMVIEGHEQAIKGLTGDRIPELLDVAHALTGKLGSEDESGQILQWIWTILGLVFEAHPASKFVYQITLPFHTYLDLSHTPIPLPVLASAADVLDAWCNAETVDTEAYLEPDDITPIEVMLDFAEKADLRAEPDSDTEDAQMEEAGDGDATDAKALATIKGNLINALIGLSSSIPASHDVFWTRMRSWLGIRQRDDLQCCALLSYGNRAREDASAIALLSDNDDLLVEIFQNLVPGIKAQVLHSVVGLLRNLSIPEANKVILGETDVLDKLVELGVWSPDKDMLGSVQGGAVGIVKNLCRGNTKNSAQLANHSKAIPDILDLLQRTDDAAIRFESTRVFVNCIRSVSTPGATEKGSFPVFEDPRIIAALLNMFKQSGPYPVLANESIIALALLVTFGSDMTCTTIFTGLSDLIDRFLGILAPKEGDEDASKEVRANLTTLLRQADTRRGERAPLLDSIRSSLKAGISEGRIMTEEGSSL